MTTLAHETIIERVLREEQEGLQWSVVEKPHKKPSGVGRRKLPTSDGHVFAFPKPDQQRYLDALGVYAVERVARRAAHVTPRQIAKWRREEWFREVELKASRDVRDILLASAWSAAVDGRLEPIYQLGRLVGYRRVHSERLHEVLLKGLLPEKFGKKPTGPTHQTIVLASPAAIRDAVARACHRPSPRSRTRHRRGLRCPSSQPATQRILESGHALPPTALRCVIQLPSSGPRSCVTMLRFGKRACEASVYYSGASRSARNSFRRACSEGGAAIDTRT